MATVGLTFGSATSGAGFDVATTVTSILAISQAIETPWKTQLATLATQDTAFTKIGTDLAAVSTSLASLTAFDGVLASKQGSSSNTDALTLSSADYTATSGSHSIIVNSLASTSSTYSSAVTSTDTLSGSLSIQVGSAAAQTITIGSTTNTLSTLAAAINAGTYGVTANIVTDSTGSRLSLVSSTAGSAGQLTLGGSLTDSTTSTGLTFATGQSGADASFSVDGVPTSSASNTVTGAIPGVTFQLLATSTAPIQVEITNDNTSIETAFQSVVTAYNAVVADIKTQEGTDSTGAAEPLFGDRTLALIQSQLSNALFAGTASGSISSIDQLGLTVGQDGTLTLDTSTLDTALNTNFSDIAGFLQTSGSWGENLTTTLDQLGSSSTTGAVSLALAQDTTQETVLNTDVTNEETLIATQKTTLTAELNLANEELQSIPSQLNEQNELYSALTGYNTGNG